MLDSSSSKVNIGSTNITQIYINETNISSVNPIANSSISPIAYYDLTKGNANDQTGNGYDGTEHGSISYSGGLVLDGNSANYIDISGLVNFFENQQEFSVVVDAQSNSSSTGAIIGMGDSSAYGGFGLDLSESKFLYIQGTSNGGTSVSLSGDASNERHLMIVTRDADNTNVYIDKQLSASGSSVDMVKMSTDKVYLGKVSSRDEYSNPFNGTIFSVKIFNKSLTEEEINNL